MAFGLTNIIRGNGRVKIGSSTYLFPKGPMSFDFAPDIVRNSVDHIGPIDYALRGKEYILTIPHCGEYEHLATLFALMAMKPGDSVFGATNTAVVVDFRDGRRLTIHRAAITKMPEINIETGSPIFGSLEIRALIDCVTPRTPDHASAYYTLQTAQTYPTDAAFDPSLIIRGPWSAAWGSDPWDSFRTEAGFKIKPAATLKPVFVDGLGVVDYTMMENSVTVEANPIGVAAQSAILTLAGAEAALGASSIARQSDLNISATGAYIRVRNAVMEKPKFRYAADPTKAIAVDWSANRSFTAGVSDDLLYVGTSAPA